jgi:bifunctional DNA-binding transcriptional regulator/antitoxin component of YhaV-PrlF toxin-antitoxin module
MTVPRAVRKALGLQPGAKLEVRLGDRAQFIVTRVTTESFFNRFKGIGRKKAPWHSGREAFEKLRGPLGTEDVDAG